MEREKELVGMTEKTMEKTDAVGAERATTVNIGREIENELRRQERTVTWMARRLSCERSNIYSIFRRQSIDTNLLLRISQILGRDFFSVYSREFENAEEEFEEST